jgi:hypothetical protein|tara:strand:+ start:23185 stop:23508 length:324 start_codon:yes stop_codon:yes gene_type:complete
MAKIENRVAQLEEWVKKLTDDNDQNVVFANVNFLLSQIRAMGNENSTITQQAQQMQGALQANNEALRVFLEKNDLVMDWQEHLEELNKEAEENAIQESGTTKVDAQE